MIARRDLFVAIIAIVAAGCDRGRRHANLVMGSAVFDGDTMQTQQKEGHSIRMFFDARTATLNELEVHVTMLDPGKAPHPPHRHSYEELFFVQQGTVETQSNGEWKRSVPAQ
jgi:quercetin dioxygenase-like cupin family protein